MDFFQQQEVDKCYNCPVKNPETKWDSSFYYKKGTGEILILLDMVEYEESFKGLLRFLDKIGLDNYQIHLALQCRTKGFKISGSIHSVYNHCNAVDFDKLDYKVILTFGRSLYSLTQTDDITYWGEFAEFQFNQTYFLHEGKRVYPAPVLSEWLGKDNFQNKFVKEIQIPRIKKFLNQPLGDTSSFKLKNVEEVEISDDPEKFPFGSYKFEIVDDPNTFLEEHMHEKEVAWDTETSGLHHFEEGFRVGCLTMSFDGITSYYLPFEKINKRLLARFFKNKISITANGKFDVKALHMEGVSGIHIDEDVILLFHMLNTDRISNSLKALAWLIGLGGYDKQLDFYRKKYRISNYLDIPTDILAPYAAIDAIATYRLYKLGKKLSKKQPKVRELYEKTLIPVLEVFKTIEITGVEVDTTYLNKFDTDLAKMIKDYEIEIKDVLGDIAINSPQQLAKALEDLGLPDLGRSTKQFYSYTDSTGAQIQKGYYKTNVDNLKKWKSMKYDIAEKLLKYRELMKLRGTFVGEYNKDSNPIALNEKEEFFSIQKPILKTGLAKFIRKDIKLHPTYGPGMTGSMRSWCHNPNLQQFPKSGKYAKDFRRVLKKPENFYIGEADFSGFQLRIAAIYSGDSTMEDIFFNRGGDMHSITGQSIFARDISVEEFTRRKKETYFSGLRKKAKMINFGFIFGRGAYSFKNDIEENWPEQEVEEFIRDNELKILEDKHTGEPDKYLTVAVEIRKRFFETYQGHADWIEGQHEFARRHGYVEDPYHGERRHLPFIMYEGEDTDLKKHSGLLNVAANSAVQGFEACHIYNSLIEIHKKMTQKRVKSVMFGMVHDSIAFYIHEDEVEDMYNLVLESMESNKFPIPIEAEFELGDIWGFGEEVSRKNLEKYI